MTYTDIAFTANERIVIEYWLTGAGHDVPSHYWPAPAWATLQTAADDHLLPDSPDNRNAVRDLLAWWAR